MKTKILSAAMSTVMLFTALTGTAAAAAEADRTEEELTTVYTTVFYDEALDGYDDCETDCTSECAHEHIYEEETESESVLERIINAVKSIVDRFISFLRSVFGKEDAPEDEEEAVADGPLYMTDTNQFTLAGDSKAEALCEEFNSLMLGFEALEADAFITKSVSVDISLTDMNLPAAAEGLVNEIIESYLIEDSYTEEFYKDEYAYIVQDITLFAEALKKAEKKTHADGSSSYEFELIEEAAYFDGYSTTGIFMYEDTATRYSLYHDRVADTLRVEYFDFGPCRIDNASILYPGSTITATTDTQGRITDLSVEMPVEGTGAVSLALIHGSVNLQGYRNEYYFIDWQS